MVENCNNAEQNQPLQPLEIPRVHSTFVKCPPDIVRLRINSMPCRFLVDSGSEVSLLDVKFVQKIEIDTSIDFRLRGITGHEISAMFM